MSPRDNGRRLRLLVVLAAAGSGCRPAPPPALSGEATPPTAREDEEPATPPIPSLEVFRQECVRRMFGDKEGNLIDLARLNRENPGVPELEAALQQQTRFCKQRAVADRDKAICERDVAPNHRAGCRLYGKTNELPVEQRGAPTAVVELSELVRAFYLIEHRHADWDDVVHGCPPAGSRTGETEFAPPLRASCRSGPNGVCVPVANPTKPWEFSSDTFGPGTPWHEMGFSPSGDQLQFHYRFEWNNDASAEGCIFQIQVRPDGPDDDSTPAFRMQYAIDRNGMTATKSFVPGIRFDDD